MSFRKLLFIMLIAITIICSLSIVAGAEEDIKVLLNDKYIEFDVKPQLLSGRTMVPMRAIFEALGAEIEWHEETRSVTAVKDGTQMRIVLDDNRMQVGYRIIILDVPAVEIGGRTLVPVRAVSEAFDCTVGWDEKSSTVAIKTKDTDKLLSLDSNYISANKFESVDGKKTYIKRGLTQVAGNKLIEWENSDVKDLYLSARVHHEMLDDDTEITLTVRVSEKAKRNEYTSYDTNVLLSKSSEFSDVQLSVPFSRYTWEKYLIKGILENKPVTICYSLYYGDKFLSEVFVDFEYTYASEKEVANRILYAKPLLKGVNSLDEQVQSGREFVSYANLAKIVCSVDIEFDVNSIYDENGYLYIFPFKFHVWENGEDIAGLQSFALVGDEKLEFSYGGDYRIKMKGDYIFLISLFDIIVSQAEFTVKLP